MKQSLTIYVFFLLAFNLNSQSITVSPNPLSNEAEISYTIALADTASIFIVNTLGQNVDTVLYKTLLNTGVYKDSIFTVTLSNGIYFVSLQLKSGSKAAKFIKLDPPTGISETDLQRIKLYPIPTSDFLNIDFTVEGQKTTLTLTNNLGKVVYFSNGTDFYERIDFRELPNGIYFLRIFNSAEFKIYKVAKE